MYFKFLLFLALFTFLNAKDYYDLLGITKDADNRDIRRAFKKLALKMHPDKNPKDQHAHDEFIKINRAYEVLKDEELRKKYDLHGEEGLESDFGKSWKGNYQSWNYYYESFGIYDDDPEVITLSRSDFEQSVLGSDDVWFINFYSPQCSHCHHLAPAWRAMARELEGVIRIGAVNCEEDWMLCRQQNINSYPSLMMYPDKQKYHGNRETDDMVAHVLNKLPNKVIMLTLSNLDDVDNNLMYNSRPWLISYCKDSEECIFPDVLKKLGVILDGLVNVGSVNVEEKICLKLKCDQPLRFYNNISIVSEANLVIQETEAKEILNEVLKHLPGPQPLSQIKFEEIRAELESRTREPWLIYFEKGSDPSQTSQNTVLKRLRGLLPAVHLGSVDCQAHPSVCTALAVRKFPTYIVFKPGGSHEFNHGRSAAHDIATFVKESLASQVKTLSPEDFPSVTHSSEPWFIDFYAPWCPPCMQLLPHWRKVSRTVGHLVKFGTVDCTIHSNLCNKYNIRSYPTTILYNQSIPHQFHGSHSVKHLEEFVKDTLSPLVISLTEESFETSVNRKGSEDMWVVDFFAPWCGPCQQLSDQWRKVAKMMKSNPTIHIAQVDCTEHSNLCSIHGINSYPTIRLYPKGSEGVHKFHYYNGWHRDAHSLQSWIYSYLPSRVTLLLSGSFNKALLDTNPWVIYFYAPWCGHCRVFAPEFEKVAQQVDGKIKAGKVNCENVPSVCQKAFVNAYPTVKFYPGRKSTEIQDGSGEEIRSQNSQEIISILESKLQFQHQSASHDEL